MNSEQIYITVASWEDRSREGARRTLTELKPWKAFLYYMKEYADWTEDNRDNFQGLCSELKIPVESRMLSFSNPAETWHLLRGDLTSPNFTQRTVTVDISTMPRDVIWTVFYFLHSMECRVNYVYHKPREYNKEWLSKDPGKPRLVYKMSGLASFGRPAVLIALTGYDVRRTEQLVRFFEPKLTLLGIQSGSQFDNQKQNIAVHSPLVHADLGIEAFEIDSYSADHGRAVIEEKIGMHLGSANIILTSLGPKLGAVAAYEVYRTHPEIALCYTPSGEYNREYSTGLGDTVRGTV